MTRVKSWITVPPCSPDALEPGAGPSCDRSIEFAFIEPPFWFLENEVGMPSRKLACGLRWVVGGPFRPAARRIVHEPHDTVGRDDIGTRGNQGRVGLKLLGDMSLGVIGIQNDQDLVAGPKEPADAVDDIWRGGISLDEGNIACKLVRFDRPTVPRTDLDVHAHHATLAAHGLEQGGIEDQRTTMSHAGFDDDIRTQREDGLLQPDEVFRVLNDRAP